MQRSLPGSLAVKLTSRVFQRAMVRAVREFERTAADAPAAQDALFRRLVAQTARTEYGRRHGVDSGIDYSRWQSRVPVVDYEDIRPWVADERARPGALVAEPVVQWVRSRCTHCTDKVVPYTAALKRSFSRALSLWGYDLLDGGLPLQKGYAYLEIEPPEVRFGGSEALADDGDYVGWPLARVMQMVVVVDPKIRRLRQRANFDRVLALSLIAAADLELVSLWHPKWLVELCSYIEAERSELARLLDDRTLHCEGLEFRFAPLSRSRRAALLAGDFVALWPSLRLVSTPAEHVDAPHAAALARRFPQARVEGKGIMTPEAPLTIPFRPAGGAVPIVDEVFYELEADDGSVCRLEDAREDVEYTLVITQAGGLVRYRVGERVRMTHRWRALPCLLHTAWASAPVCDVKTANPHSVQTPSSV